MAKTEEIGVPLQPARPSGATYRLGALALFVGGGAGLLFNAAHPRAGFTSTAKIMKSIAASSTWTTVHIGLIFAVLAITLGIAILSRTIVVEPAASLAGWARLMVGIGTAILAVGLAIDGPALKAVAEAWANASGVEKALNLATAEAVFRVEQGISGIGFLVFLGLGLGLLGYSIVRSRAYPEWTGWVLVGGAAVATIDQLAWTYNGGITLTMLWVLSLTSLAMTIALVALAMEMWRRRDGRLGSPGSDAGDAID